MTPEILIAVATARTVSLDRISSGGRPQYTVAEVGMACRGMPAHVFDAAMYVYAGDDGVRSRLAAWLLEWALSQRKSRRWPIRVVTLAGPRPFTRDLCDLYLLKLRSPSLFVRRPKHPHPMRAALNVSEGVWSARVLPIYLALDDEFKSWLLLADEIIERRTRGR